MTPEESEMLYQITPKGVLCLVLMQQTIGFDRADAIADELLKRLAQCANDHTSPGDYPALVCLDGKWTFTSVSEEITSSTTAIRHPRLINIHPVEST